MSEPHPPSGPPEDPDVRHEPSDINVRGVLGVAVAMVVIAVILHVLLGVMFKAFKDREQAASPPPFPVAGAKPPALPPIPGRGLLAAPLFPSPLAPSEHPPRLPPAPQQQIAPSEDLQIMRAAEEQHLASYGWVDLKAGVVRIPIERAIDRLLTDPRTHAKYLAVEPRNSTRRARPEEATIPSGSSSGRVLEPEHQ